MGLGNNTHGGFIDDVDQSMVPQECEMKTGNGPIRNVSRRTILKASTIAAGTLGFMTPAAASEVITETEDVFGQGPSGGVVAEDGATIRRTANSISIELSMPTPVPGSYTYPSMPPGGAWTDEEGPPEGFTLWAFIFNNPLECTNGCGGPEDIGGDAGGGAFFVAGHMVSGPNLTLSGNVSMSSEPVAGSSLENPEGAEVHLAVAPHGALDPEKMPDQIKTPTGPGPDIWWLALFE